MRDYDPLEESQEPEGGLDLRALMAVVRRRRKVFALALLVALIPVPVVPFLLEPSFQALATLAIEETPGVLDFDAEVVPGSSAGRRARDQLLPMMAILLSDQVLGRVVDYMPDVGDAPPGLAGRTREFLGFGRERAVPHPAMERKGRIEAVRAMLELGEQAGGTILEVGVHSLNPGEAVWLANRVADAFVQFQLEQRQNASSTAVRWLSENAAVLRGQIRNRDAALSSLTARLGAALEHGPGGDQAAYAELLSELKQAERDLQATKDQRAALLRQIRARPDSSGSPELAALNERNRAARDALEASRMIYRESHPEVQRLAAVVATLEAQLGPESARPPLEDANKKEEELQALDTERLRLDARVGVLRKALAEISEPDPVRAEALAQRERLERENDIDRAMLQVIMERMNRTIISAASVAPPVRVLDHAAIAKSTSASKRQRALALAIVVAFAFAGGIAGLSELVDRAVYEPEQVAALLGVPVLSSIPLVVNGSSAERMSSIERATPAAEGIRNLRTAILFAAGRSRLGSLLISSAVATEGKTTISMNLAASFAHTGRRVVLLDADLRRPRVNKVLALSRAPGLSEVLSGEQEWSTAVRQPSGFNFDVITSGEIPRNPVELIGSPQMDRLLDELKAEYDLMVIDAPVLLAVADSLLLSAKVDFLLLVTKPGSVDRGAFAKIKTDLDRAHARLIGVVSNQVNPRHSYEYPDYLCSPYVEDDGGRRGSGSV